MFTNIRTASTAQGLHLFELAERCGLHPSALSEIIGGRRVADAKLRAKMAKVLECDEAWLFAEPAIPKSAAMREAVA